MNPAQTQLPLKLIETRAARMQRLLSGGLGRVVKLASEFTFTPKAAVDAAAKAVVPRGGGSVSTT